MKTTVDILLKYSGGSPFLSRTQLAGVLDRSPEGLKKALDGNGELARQFNPVKKKIGRRVYFPVLDVAKLLDEATCG